MFYNQAASGALRRDAAVPIENGTEELNVDVTVVFNIG